MTVRRDAALAVRRILPDAALAEDREIPDPARAARSGRLLTDVLWEKSWVDEPVERLAQGGRGPHGLSAPAPRIWNALSGDRLLSGD
jgi:hypothetical protein